MILWRVATPFERRARLDRLGRLVFEVLISVLLTFRMIGNGMTPVVYLKGRSKTLFCGEVKNPTIWEKMYTFWDTFFINWPSFP